jgi:hypothetical protein
MLAGQMVSLQLLLVDAVQQQLLQQRQEHHNQRRQGCGCVQDMKYVCMCVCVGGVRQLS